MATAIDIAKAADEYKDAKCSICAKKNKDKIADYYCFDCNKHMCKACLGTHNKFIDYHNVVQGLGNDKDVLTEKCGKHADQLITLYCRQHDELLCRKCHLYDHRQCQDPQNIRESSDELNADPELQAVPAHLQSVLDNINKAIEALDEHLVSIKKNGKSCLKDLEVYAKKLLSRIEELKEKGKNDIKSKQEELLAVVKHHRQACALIKDDIYICLDKITKSKEWKAEMFVLKKKGQTIAQKFDALYKESDGLIKRHQFNFMTEMKILDSINCFYSLVKEVSTEVQDISSQGAMGGEVDRPVQAIVRSHGDRQARRPVEKRGDKPVLKPAKKPRVENPSVSKQVRNIDVRIPGDEDICSIIGFCHLSDGSLVIADSRSKRLKCVDPSSSKVTKYCDTDGRPLDLCSFGPQEVAVTFHDSTEVHVYNTESLTRTQTVEVGHLTGGIACHGRLLYCAGWDYSKILYVHYVRSGKKLREISKDTDGRELFSEIRHIAVNSRGDRLYVADGMRGLVCVGTDGRPIFHLSHQDLGLSCATGVTTDHHGHVFVSGVDSHNVVKVTEDGHVVGQILSEEDGIKWSAICLSYDVSRSSLFVGGVSDQLLMVEWK